MIEASDVRGDRGRHASVLDGLAGRPSVTRNRRGRCHEQRTAERAQLVRRVDPVHHRDRPAAPAAAGPTDDAADERRGDRSGRDRAALPARPHDGRRRPRAAGRARAAPAARGAPPRRAAATILGAARERAAGARSGRDGVAAAPTRAPRARRRRAATPSRERARTARKSWSSQSGTRSADAG